MPELRDKKIGDASSLEIKKVSDNSAIVKFKKEMNIETSPQINREIIALINEGFINLKFDFSDLQFIDSTGMGVLIGIRATLRSKKGNVSLSNLSPRVEKILRTSKLLDIFKIE